MVRGSILTTKNGETTYIRILDTNKENWEREDMSESRVAEQVHHRRDKSWVLRINNSHEQLNVLFLKKRRSLSMKDDSGVTVDNNKIMFLFALICRCFNRNHTWISTLEKNFSPFHVFVLT